ncbi:hypothetical protein [Alkalicoccus chagannorensis]|uniref:hypothetical protein n=1 Tax=Alkalicoccus chagannorensis TaxID=427072 RepID=UPI00041A9A9D|nr:hypothetical protein [Alkalicoccus chagannorensis]
MKVVLFLLSVFILAACTPRDFDDATLLETRNTAPESAGAGDQFMDQVDSEEEVAEHWENYSFPGSPPDVDMEESIVLFFKTGENSCEKEIDNIVAEGSELHIEIEQDDTCDDLYQPRSIAVEVERTLLEDLEQVHFDGASFSLDEE